MPIWTLLKKVGYGGGEYADSGASLLPLDPIDIEVANMSRIFEAARAVPLFWKIVRRVESLEAFEELVAIDHTRRLRYTNKKYASHLKSLERWKVTVPCPMEQIRFFVSYFAVAKNDTMARSIVNAKRFSTMCKVPPPVNIPCITDVLKRLNAAAATPMWIVYGDIRHFFHAIPIGASIGNFFGILLKQQAYRWSRLPMGWSHSPVTAQAIAWLLISFRFEHEESMLDETVFRGAQLPTFVQLGRYGWCCITYDNYVCVVNDVTIASSFHVRIARNANYFGLQLKEHDMRTSRRMRESDEPVILLGVQVCTIKRRFGIRWRVNPKKLKMQNAILTRRDAARVVGRCLYRKYIMLLPLVLASGALELIAILRKVAESKGESWDARHHLDEDQVRLLRVELQELMVNEWITVEHGREPTETIYVVSDASLEGHGYVVLRKDGAMVHQHMSRWNAEMSKLHIFFLELRSAIEAQQWIRESMPSAVIYHAIDNSAARQVLEHGYSSTLVGNKWLKSHLGGGLLHVRYVPIASADNAADELSHLKPCSLTRVTKSLNVIWAHIAGTRFSSEQGHFFPPGCDGYRHAEPEDPSPEDDIASSMDDDEEEEMYEGNELL